MVHGVGGADRRGPSRAGGEAVGTVRDGDHAPVRCPEPRTPSCASRGSRCRNACRTGATTSTYERAFHAYGASFTDRTRAFNLQFPNPPDVVAHPRDEHELEITLDWCDRNGYVAIPYGGGSSVVWGVNPPDDCGPCVTIALDRLDRVLEIDEVSRAARIQAGVLGPALEQQLKPSGHTLRHFPQSFRFSSLGRMDRHPFWRALRDQPHAHRRLRRVDSDADAAGVVGEPPAARQRRRTES